VRESPAEEEPLITHLTQVLDCATDFVETLKCRYVRAFKHAAVEIVYIKLIEYQNEWMYKREKHKFELLIQSTIDGSGVEMRHLAHVGIK